MKKFSTRLAAIFAAVFVAAFVLTGCVASAPTEGIILDKTYAPAHDETYQVSVQTYDYGCHNVSHYDYDSEGYVSEYVCEYYYGDHGEKEDRVRHIPDKWTILFEGEDGDGNLREGTVVVSQAQYDEAHKGYYIKIVEDAVFINAR